MMNKLRQVAYEALCSLGIEIHRKREPLRFLSPKNIQTVLDVGANEGQFARKARKRFPKAKIYAFEPVPRVFKTLVKNLRNDLLFEAVNMGLGEESGEIDFAENKFSASSSALDITQRGRQAFPFTSETRKIRVAMTTLDTWAEGRSLQSPILVKMDVQGFEDRVIRGGRRTIQRASAVITEVSFVSLYENQPLFGEIFAVMCELGFTFVGMLGSTCDPATDEILQGDAIFVPSHAS